MDTNNKLTPSTWVPISLLGGAFILGGSTFGSYALLKEEIRNGSVTSHNELTLGLATMHEEARDIKDDVRSLHTDLAAKTSDIWTRTEMRIFQRDLQRALGPSVVVPSVDH